MRAVLRPVHRGLVHLITLGVLAQAILAGQFISGASDQLGTHGAVGGTLELAGLALLLLAVAHRLAGERSRVALWGSLALGLALQVQAALGWMPGAAPTSVHVPLGVCIFAGALTLSLTLGRQVGDALEAERRRHPSGTVDLIRPHSHG
jgi:hypothetical protein